jgi:hypothetical protein
MTTAREFIELALKEAGVTGVGQTPLAQDMNDGFTYLSRMLAQWQKRRWLIPGLTHITMPGNDLKSNKIGPGQYYNAIRPAEIKSAWFTQSNVGNNNRVSFPLRRIWSYEDYTRLALKDLNTWPQAFFYDGAFPYGNVYIWPTPSEAYQINLVLQLPIGFSTAIVEGEFEGGDGYTPGNYVAVPLIGDGEDGFTKEGGNGATVDVTVGAGGDITNVDIVNGGNGYNIGNVLDIDTTIVGAGTGFEFTVTNTEGSLDSEFNMPTEYEEPIHSNLVIRLCAGYNKPTNSTTVALAKVGLNTIKRANSQIPTLSMPPMLRLGGGGFNIYNPDGGNLT